MTTDIVTVWLAELRMMHNNFLLALLFFTNFNLKNTKNEHFTAKNQLFEDNKFYYLTSHYTSIKNRIIYFTLNIEYFEFISYSHISRTRGYKQSLPLPLEVEYFLFSSYKTVFAYF